MNAETTRLLLPTDLRDRPRLGIATFVGNLALMALIGAAVRELVARGYPLAEVLLWRYVFAAGLFWALLVMTAGLAGLVTRRPLDHAIRGASGVLSLGLFYFAITRIPIADATALAYAAPIFITVLSIFLLGEVIGPRRWIAVVAGFIGVLLIARPGGAGWDIGVAAAAGSAVTGALVAIWLRKLASSERAVTIGLYYNSLGVGVCAAWTIFAGWLTPRGDDWLLFAAFALGCGAQQGLLTISFRYAEASVLAPFEYLAMVFAAIVGYAFWGEVPSTATWLGAAIIAGSGLFIFMHRQQAQPRNPPAPPVIE